MFFSKTTHEQYVSGGCELSFKKICVFAIDIQYNTSDATQIGQEIELSRFQLSSSCVESVCGFRSLLEIVKMLIKSNHKGFLKKYLIFTKG